MANATDFIGSVYDTLSKTLTSANSAAGNYLQMAWPGYSLSPNDFKPANAPNGPYDPNVAEETFSNLANIAPTDNTLSFENSGFLIDQLYDILLQSATPIGATADTIQNNPMFKMFSDAQFAMMSAQKGSVDDPNEFYHKCDATPANWYDEHAAASWSTINIKSTDVTPTTPASPFIKFGGAALISNGIMRMRPDVTRAPLVIAGMQNTMAQHATLINTKFKPMVPLTTPVVTRPMIAMKAIVPVKGMTVADKLTADRSKVIFTQRLAPVNSFAAPALKTAISGVDISKMFQANSLKIMPLAQSFVLKNLLIKQLPVKPISAATTGFSISFRYCRVTINRPWLNLPLLGMPNWYIPFTPKGQYSTGTADNNAGMFPFLPTSFIIIRDLKITANWSAEDKANLANSTSFGPFDTSTGSFNQDTFEADGLQVIAWISKLMPPLAPMEVANP